MSVMGLRCWNDRFAYVVLSGTQKSPVVVAKDVSKCPRGQDRCECLSWVRQEMGEILNRHGVAKAFYKATEGVARPDAERCQLEGVAMEAAWSHKRLKLEPLRKQQIKKMTGFDDPARYVQNVVSLRGLDSVDSATYKDAAMVALSGLPDV